MKMKLVAIAISALGNRDRTAGQAAKLTPFCLWRKWPKSKISNSEWSSS
jgi:hypothetical protein